jgi:hypothetical protein
MWKKHETSIRNCVVVAVKVADLRSSPSSALVIIGCALFITCDILLPPIERMGRREEKMRKKPRIEKRR